MSDTTRRPRPVAQLHQGVFPSERDLEGDWKDMYGVAWMSPLPEVSIYKHVGSHTIKVIDGNGYHGHEAQLTIEDFRDLEEAKQWFESVKDTLPRAK